jgi:hypothetical protein
MRYAVALLGEPMRALCFFAVVLVGCDAPPKESVSTVSSGVEKAAVPMPAPPTVPEPQQAKPPDPLAGTSLTEQCNNDELLLIQDGFEALRDGGWVKLCCGGSEPVFELGRCEMDWPNSDVPDCSYWDELRNQIYARYGYPFKSKKWRDVFEKTSWYTPREDFSESWLSEHAIANVALLKRHAAEKYICADFDAPNE